MYKRQLQGGSWQPDDFFESFEETPYHIAILTYLGYALMVVIGHVRDFMRRYGLEQDKSVIEPKVEVGNCSAVDSFVFVADITTMCPHPPTNTITTTTTYIISLHFL